MPVLGNAKVEEVGSVEETFGFLFFLFIFLSKPPLQGTENSRKNEGLL